MKCKNVSAIISNFKKCGNHGKSVLLLLAKYEAELTQHEKKNETVDLYVSDPKAFLAFELNTNNFSPVYCKGDKVLLEDRFPRSGERALFTKDCTLYCRTFIEDTDGYTLKCLNRLGKDFKLKRMDDVECLGTCIGIVRE